MSKYTNFVIFNKVALVTGGASGIGFCIVKELLKNGAKGVIIVDINAEQGEKILNQIQNEFGQNKAIFVNCDVSNVNEFEKAFQKGVDHFKSLDIVVNNAGVVNEDDFQKCISVNLIGVINGINLALNTYLPKYRTDENNSIILNTASILFNEEAGFIPAYAATKAAVVSLTRSWGCKDIYQQSRIRVIGICPGRTATPILTEIRKVSHPWSKNIIQKTFVNFQAEQTPEQCAQGATRVIQTAPSGTIWILDEGQSPYEYKFSTGKPLK